jgi:hypothetical protein
MKDILKLIIRLANFREDDGAMDLGERLLDIGKLARGALHDLKAAKPAITITVLGGCVSAVYASFKQADVELLDWDNAQAEGEDSARKLAQRLSERMGSQTPHVVL